MSKPELKVNEEQLKKLNDETKAKLDEKLKTFKRKQFSILQHIADTEDKEWTPGYGVPYFKEKEYYISPKVRDVNLPDDRSNIPNSTYLQPKKIRSDDEILSIWGAPLKNFEPTEEEIKQLKEKPYRFKSLLHLSPHAPCIAHIKNMLLDRCDKPDLGTKNKTMLQFSACNQHHANYVHCYGKHRKWYEARHDAFRKVAPEIVEERFEHVHYAKDPDTYKKYA